MKINQKEQKIEYCLRVPFCVVTVQTGERSIKTEVSVKKSLQFSLEVLGRRMNKSSAYGTLGRPAY